MTAAAEAAAHIVGSRSPSDILIVADHASAHVPPDIALGVPDEILTRHVAVDIGVDPLARGLCDAIGCGAVLGAVSRLVCDFNRDEDAAGLVPVESDGIAIPGNVIDAAAREARLARFFRPYHAAVADAIAASRPTLVVSLHSFTPRLASRPDEVRPWQIGILYNQDARAAQVAIPRLEADGIVTGDNQPYSGRVLNATMNRHAEAAGLAYLGIEVRQDQIDTADGVARWCARLAPVIVATRNGLAAQRA
jgi:predicted N-formylglutamate amidohydrolase